MNLREIDRLVAEKVMGWKLRKYFEDDCYITDEWVTDIEDKFGNGVIVIDVDKFNPSTNIQDSWQVVEELIDRGYDFNLWRSEQREYNAEFQIQKEDGFVVSYGESDHAPTAICFASLEAVGVDVNDYLQMS